jgi:hypothetical protein
MRLPEQIPASLRALALFLPELEEGEGAWSRHDALAVLDSLKGTTIAASNVVVFEGVPGGYVALENDWSGARLPNEPDPDYAQRSRSGAVEFIRRCKVVSEHTLFALTFPMWKDAA